LSGTSNAECTSIEQTGTF